MNEYAVPTKDGVTCVHCGCPIRNHDTRTVCHSEGCGYAPCGWWDGNDRLDPDIEKAFANATYT